VAATAVGLALAVAAAQAQPAKPQPAGAKPQSAAAKPPTSAAAAKPLTEAELKMVDELQAAQKEFDTDVARALAGSPVGRRRVAETVARHFNVSEKIVNEIRARRIGYGEVTIALSLSQQLMKREKGLALKQAVDRVVTLRKSGQGWGNIARDLGLRLGDGIADVKKADKQLAKLDTVKLAKADKPRPR
jgi:hypothetical protein